MGPVAGSLILAGRNIMLVAQKLHLQPECQSLREELVITAQQILRLIQAELAGWSQQSSLLGSMGVASHSHNGHLPEREKPAYVSARAHYQFNQC